MGVGSTKYMERQNFLNRCACDSQPRVDIFLLPLHPPEIPTCEIDRKVRRTMVFYMAITFKMFFKLEFFEVENKNMKYAKLKSSSMQDHFLTYQHIQAYSNSIV